MLTIKGVWLDRLYKLEKILCIFISLELTWKNIKSIKELKSFELSKYLVKTWLIGADNFRLSKSVILLRVSTYSEW